MKIERHEQNGRMSKAVIHGDTIYLCGHVCTEAGRDVKAQTKGILDAIDQRLEQYGSDREHILSATIYLKDIGTMFAPMNEVWDAWVSKGNEPARTCVEARLASEDCWVEITVVAAKK